MVGPGLQRKGSYEKFGKFGEGQTCFLCSPGRVNLNWLEICF